MDFYFLESLLKHEGITFLIIIVIIFLLQVVIIFKHNAFDLVSFFCKKYSYQYLVQHKIFVMLF